MRRLHLITAIIVTLFLTSCASMKPVAFADGTPKLDPVTFYGGRTRSTGVVETPGGKPSVRITTKTSGTLKDKVLYITQDLYPEGQKSNHRTFQLHQIDEHHVDATAEDIDGVAHGYLYGNTFTWTFRRKMTGRKFIKHVRMSQFMYLMPDGKTMIIRSIIRKFDFVVAQITEQFEKY